MTYFFGSFNLFVILVIGFKNIVEGEDKCPAPLKDCSKEHIQFFLYTDLKTPPQELILNDAASIAKVKFIQNADFKFLIHGYGQSRNSPDWVTLREEYIKQKQWNLLVVDYNPVATWGCYYETTLPSVGKIGRCIADFLTFLFKGCPDINIDRFHFVGHSIGSHICAQVSNNLKPAGMIIPRITGCDPAGPGFSETEEKIGKNKLNREHAKFVDTIHTNMGIAGVVYSNAHYDTYASDGEAQPGCESTDILCSHNRGLKIFADTVNSPVKIIAQKCDSKDAWINNKKCTGDHKLKIEIGEHCPPPKSAENIGIYQFNTNAGKPFAIPPPSH